MLSSGQCTQCHVSRTMRSGAENGFMGMGIGAAMTGLRPIVEGMNMGFLLLAFNQISNNIGMLHYTSGGQYKVPRSRFHTNRFRILCPVTMQST